MPTTKKTTFLQKDCFIVAGNDQTAFPSGNLVTTGTNLNIGNGFISAVCSSSDSTLREYYEHLQNTAQTFIRLFLPFTLFKELLLLQTLTWLEDLDLAIFRL